MLTRDEQFEFNKLVVNCLSDRYNTEDISNREVIDLSEFLISELERLIELAKKDIM